MPVVGFKKIEQLMHEVDDEIYAMIAAAKLQERERLLTLMKADRATYNAERGGQYCDKPYLAATNMRVSILDDLIQRYS